MYKAGQYKQVCDVCGFEFFSGETRKRWDGLIVCKDDYETDHPQKFVHVMTDGFAVKDPRPEPDDVFVAPLCYIFAQHSYADMGEADCMQAGKQTFSYQQCVALRGY